jgi:hypothetical protein
VEHNLDDWTCWCQPRVTQPCPVCAGEVGDTGCDQCAGTGWVAGYDPEQPAVIIHQGVLYA